MPAAEGRRGLPALNERRTSPLELLWDLVFVFAVTQVTTLLSHDLSWGGFGKAMLVLALVWWAWSAFVWAANAEDPDSPTLRAVLLVATPLIFVTGLALPHAFRDHATLFAATYAGVRLMHLALYADASRRGNASWSAIVGFAITVVVGMALLVGGSFLDEGPRVVVWVLAAAIDYAGPAWLTRERLRGLQQVAVAHFAERYGLFVIICLGESIVAIGLTASGLELDGRVVAAVTLGLVITIGLWWTYFDRLAGSAEEHLRAHEDPVLAAADAYSYIHLAIVAGIIIFAVGVKAEVHDAAAELSDAARLALCGGVAIFLVGLTAFRLRLVGSSSWEKLTAAAAVMLIFVVGSGLPAWAVAGAVTLVLAALCARETMLERASRGLARK